MSEQTEFEKLDAEEAKKRENLRPMTIGQVVGRTVYTGRNERCPCGSGLKYKKCHRVYQMG